MLWFLTGSLTLFLPLRLFYNLHPLKFLHEISRPDLPALRRFPRLISTTRFTLFRFSSSANTDLKIGLPENSLELPLYLQPLHLLPGDIGLFFFFLIPCCFPRKIYPIMLIIFLGFYIASYSVMVDLTGLVCLERKPSLIHIACIQETFRDLVCVHTRLLQSGRLFVIPPP